MKQHSLVLPIFLYLFAFNSVSAQIPDDIRKHFDEHIVGQWTFETTWGDQRITGQGTNAWDESGVAIRGISSGVDAKGKLQTTEIHGWDAATSEMIFYGFDSRGSTWTVRWKRANGTDTSEWVGRGIGTYDGKKWESATKLSCGKDQWRYEDITDGKPFITVGKRAKSATAQTSTPEQFAEFGKLLVGRWASKVTLIADWPEFKQKQGEVINGYSTLEWQADKHAIREEELGGEATFIGLIWFDLPSKTIRNQTVTSAGNSNVSVFWKDGNSWRWKLENGMLSDGKRLTGAGQYIFENNGNTMIREGTVFLDGKELPRYHDVYTRVNKN